MPIHDWSKVPAGIYHSFHLRWIASIMDQLNAGLLPQDYYALAEQVVGRPEGDVVALQTKTPLDPPITRSGATAIAPLKPQTHFVQTLLPEQERYARRANRIVVRHYLGDVVAVIELVSPGNKDRKHSLETFTHKTIDLLNQNVSVLIVDPFPPGKWDPEGIHGAIWGELSDDLFTLPADKLRTLVSYQAAPIKTAYVETIAVGDPLPEMPLFLHEDYGISVPLEETYLATWKVQPFPVREMLDPRAER